MIRMGSTALAISITGVILGTTVGAAPQLVIVPHKALAREPLTILVGSSRPVSEVIVHLTGTPAMTRHFTPKDRGHSVYQVRWTPPHAGKLTITAMAPGATRIATMTTVVSPSHTLPIAHIATVALLVIGGLFLWQRTRAR